MNVPIRNVYWLLLYAWNHLGSGEEASLSAGEPRHLHELFAHVLASTVTRLTARGLDRGYLRTEATLAGVRGRIEMKPMVARGLLGTGRAHCSFDELSHDVLHNRILKATLRSLLRLEMDDAVTADVRRTLRRLDTVADIRLSRSDFGRVQLHRNNRVYDFALRLCRLIHDNLIVDPTTGRAAFHDFRADQRRMGALFEAFVFRFYRREQTRFRVARPKVRWFGAQGSAAAISVLPEMRTDVVLRSDERRIIIETKFYADPLAGRYGARKLRSGHLYQLLAYLQNRQASRRRFPAYEGMLLYPVVGEAFAYDFILSGFPVAVRSVDLDRPWPDIHRQMLALLTDAPGGVHPPP